MSKSASSPWSAQRVFNVPLPAGVHAFMSTREGGHSRAPWNSMNLGDHVGDDVAHVQANREGLAAVLGARPVFLQQVHGTGVVELQEDSPHGTVADACFSFVPGLACTIMVADCLPVLLWDLQGRWVAAAHAGWRGLAGHGGCGVLETLWTALSARRAQAQDTGVWLGPCIGPTAFEVGSEVRQAFDGERPDRAWAFQTQAPNKEGEPRWLADLPGLARMRLAQLGLTQVAGNDGTPGWCTVSRPALYFSHRRDAVRLGTTGRMAACIWRD